MVQKFKFVKCIEILHLSKKGYGPEGKDTRNQWRAECIENLMAGKESFEAWQKSLLAKTLVSTEVSFEAHKILKKDSEEIVLSNHIKKSSTCTLDFTGYEFENIKFCDYHFLFDCIFDFCIFKSEAFFDRSIFEKYAKFNYVEFKDFSWFGKVEFKNDVRFNNAVFERFADLGNIQFHSDAGFYNTKFLNQAKFSGSKFRSSALFNNVSFYGVGSFNDARFYKSIPNFGGCKLDRTQLEFSDEDSFTHEDFSEDDIKNISFLKRLSDEHGQVDQALNFNAMELRAKRRNVWQKLAIEKGFLNLFPNALWQLLVKLTHVFNGQFWFCVFTWAYEKFSDFGRSFTRPLFYLFGLLCISYLFGVVSAFENSPSFKTHSVQPIFSELSRVYCYQKIKPCLSGYRAATEYSLYRSGNFLDFTDVDKNIASINMRLFSSEIEPWWARIFGFIKGIATAVLLFLIALGLRNKYRVS